MAVTSEFARQPLLPPRLVEDAALAALPPVVARYVRASGAVGQPVPRNMRLVFDAEMFRAPGQAAMRAQSVQFNFFERPARLFLMRARMFGLPVRALHLYRDAAATFQVRVASLKNIVDVSGPQLSEAETVTVLNDLCVFAPGAIADARLEWGVSDGTSAEVQFTNGPHVVRATLEFDSESRLVDFWSDDRPDASTGRPVGGRWNTPIEEYRQFGASMVASGGSAVYQRESGPFEYGRFQVRAVEWDLARPPWVVGPASVRVFEGDAIMDG